MVSSALDFEHYEIPPAIFAITAFAFNEAAYMSETILAAIQAVDVGEIGELPVLLG